MKAQTLPLTLAALFSLVFVGPAAASERTCAYSYDASGTVVRDGSGDCVRTGSWRKEGMIVECGAAPAEPEPMAEPEPAPAPAPKPVVKTVSLSAGALFAVNSDVIGDEGKAELDALAAHIAAMNVERINIAGHTDSSGAADYNKSLSMKRAIAVKNYLLDKGVDPSIMTTVGWGEEKPIASNATKEGRAKNRRVEITLTGSQEVK